MTILDAVGTKRYESNSGGEREIQRTMLELLNQLDGFDYRGDVKVIMATNRIETLDPALIRPGEILVRTRARSLMNSCLVGHSSRLCTFTLAVGPYLVLKSCTLHTESTTRR